jgi:hypothetical protein
MNICKYISICLCVMCVSCVYGDEIASADSGNTEKLREIFSQGVVVDLKDPVLRDGILTTDKGGVITAPGMRIQAKTIKYIRKNEGEESIFRVEAEGDLMVDYGPRIFVGRRIEYDFNEERGIVYDGKTFVNAWYIGGERIILQPDGSYKVLEGFITTSENIDSEWSVNAANVRIPTNDLMAISNIQFRFLKYPLFWMPSFKTNLKKFVSAPVQWRFHWGGSQGPRIGMRYKFLSKENFDAFLRLDYRTRRGIGGGIETKYLSPDEKEHLLTRNYIAYDTSISDSTKRRRFRFDGDYEKKLYEDRLLLDLHYDRLSDEDMVSDFDTYGFDIGQSKRTHLRLRHIREQWMATLFSSVRINNFQSLKQELPTLHWRVFPFSLGDSGVMMDNNIKMSFLDFVHAKGVAASDYHSARIQLDSRLYKPFSAANMTITPRAGFLGTYYTNSADGDGKWIGMGAFGGDISSSLYSYYGTSKHVIEPYVGYTYYTSPSSSPSQHYIFDEDDALTEYNVLRFGIRNSYFTKDTQSFSRPLLFADIYGNAFFYKKVEDKKIPSANARVVWQYKPKLTLEGKAGWDFIYDEFDHYSGAIRWTKNEDLAASIEYLHRSAHSWRKADRTSFFLESWRSQAELDGSVLSEKKNTLLAKVFYRFSPSWLLQFQTRKGSTWMATKRNYNEYQLDLVTILRWNWKIKVSFQSTEDDKRVAFYVKLLEKPEGLLSSPSWVWP